MSADIVAVITVMGAFIATVGGVIATIILNRGQARKAAAEAAAIEAENKRKDEQKANDQLAFLTRVGEIYDSTIARNQAEIKALQNKGDLQDEKLCALEIKYSELEEANETLRQAIIKFVHAFEIYIMNAKPGAKLDEILRQLAELKAKLNPE